MTPSLEGLLTKAEEVHSSHKVRLAPLDTNPVFQCLRANMFIGNALPDVTSVKNIKWVGELYRDEWTLKKMLLWGRLHFILNVVNLKKQFLRFFSHGKTPFWEDMLHILLSVHTELPIILLSLKG